MPKKNDYISEVNQELRREKEANEILAYQEKLSFQREAARSNIDSPLNQSDDSFCSFSSYENSTLENTSETYSESESESEFDFRTPSYGSDSEDEFDTMSEQEDKPESQQDTHIWHTEKPSSYVQPKPGKPVPNRFETNSEKDLSSQFSSLLNYQRALNKQPSDSDSTKIANVNANDMGKLAGKVRKKEAYLYQKSLKTEKQAWRKERLCDAGIKYNKPKP